eukprot:TRINITY_DN3390_c0_g1_i3.p1 TRINITY_DN3390_c0_g1~~TRINITY_DN3390_c0_g1_i3.p1  ORF type:complete len:130 (+),score=7.00 TRINITY_DN3390_c0_g1_i3:444-833(+)
MVQLRKHVVRFTNKVRERNVMQFTETLHFCNPPGNDKPCWVHVEPVVASGVAVPAHLIHNVLARRLWRHTVGVEGLDEVGQLRDAKSREDVLCALLVQQHRLVNHKEIGGLPRVIQVGPARENYVGASE